MQLSSHPCPEPGSALGTSMLWPLAEAGQMAASEAYVRMGREASASLCVTLGTEICSLAVLTVSLNEF